MDGRRFADDSVLSGGVQNLEDLKHREEERAVMRNSTSQVARIKGSTNALKKSIQKSKKRGRVQLPVASENLGEPVFLEMRRMTLQEISASYAFPPRADNLVSELIRRGAAATETANAEYGVEVPSPKSVVEEIYGGMNREAAAALFEFQAIVCCVCCVDANTRLCYTQEEVDEDPEGRVLIWDVEDDDVTTLFDWVFYAEEEAVEAVTPFPNGAVPDRVVGVSTSNGQTAVRSTEV